jgi:acyl-CoA thioesterase I
MSTARAKILVAVILIAVVSIASFAFFLKTYSPPYSVELPRVACVGDSITEITSYVSMLQAKMNQTSTIGNFGKSGATVSLSSVEPYLLENISKAAQVFQPNIVIILLGTNDARQDVYPYIDTFVSDYKLLISKFQALESNPKIYLALPPPIFNNTIGISTSHLADEVIPRIRQVANETGLPLIDIYTPMLNHPEYFVDGVHPNDDGARVIAETVYRGILF